MRISHFMVIASVFALVGLPWTFAEAAEEGAAVAAEEPIAPPEEDLNALLEDPNLTSEEREALTLATQEFQGGWATDPRGAAAEGPDFGNLGAPEIGLGGLSGTASTGTLTAREQALMSEVTTLEKNLAQKGLSPEQIHNEIETQMGDRLRREGVEQGVFQPGERDDFRLRELYNQGRPVEGAFEQRSGFEHSGPAAAGLERGMSEIGSREFGPPETSGQGLASEGAYREQAERGGWESSRDSSHGRESTESRGGESRETSREAPEMQQREAPEAHESYREAPETYREAPESYREAPEVSREAPEARETYREAPETYREAPETYREAPETYREAPETYRDAPEGPGGGNPGI